MDSLENSKEVIESMQVEMQTKLVPMIFVNGQFVGGYSQLVKNLEGGDEEEEE